MTLKFSIVTPAYNSERYIRDTIESVIKQKGDFRIEYIVLDNHSTDKTCSIVREYQELLAQGKVAVGCHEVQIYLISEHDSGMYDAIKNGFSHANGDVFAWINSDDIYLPGAFEVIRQSLEAYPEIKWIKGITSYINKNSTIYAVGDCGLYYQDWINEGLYGTTLNFIQQDSVFWRADLWRTSGGVNSKLTLAGDYFLWRSFAESTPLYSLNAYVSCFRKTDNQKSADMRSYWREIRSTSVLDDRRSSRIRRKLVLVDALPRFLRPLCYRFAFGKHKYHLITLEGGVTPRLRTGNYFQLKEMT